MARKSPFNRKKKIEQSACDWWLQLLKTDYEDVSILGALAIKVLSAMPVSMVEEHSVSFTTWINGAHRNRQNINMVSNHLTIHQFKQIHSNAVKAEPKPPSIKWRDMHMTIHQQLQAKKSNSNTKNGKMMTSSTVLTNQVESRFFDVKGKFDITSPQLLDILGDIGSSSSNIERTMGSGAPLVQDLAEVGHCEHGRYKSEVLQAAHRYIYIQLSDDEPPGSVHSEIADTTYNLSPISLMRTFNKPNVASPAQVESYSISHSTQTFTLISAFTHGQSHMVTRFNYA
ncbi:hypothetical protein ARMGADRAFT_1031146 [Armillaria gallica]|uniref:Uncharacterized protein n=1 Tax=Armillaria gallica TaxID=47427 RepID=A0A2H3DAI0_ARMGA|nr:hypothetical protein ARMGADRAFT_1031146 [Armillaria gallica]